MILWTLKKTIVYMCGHHSDTMENMKLSLILMILNVIFTHTYLEDGKEMSVEAMYKGVISGIRSFHYGKQNKIYGPQEYLVECENGEVKETFAYENQLGS